MSSNSLNERQSAPTGAQNSAPQQERQDPLGGAACSPLDLSALNPVLNLLAKCGDWRMEHTGDMTQVSFDGGKTITPIHGWTDGNRHGSSVAFAAAHVIGNFIATQHQLLANLSGKTRTPGATERTSDGSHQGLLRAADHWTPKSGSPDTDGQVSASQSDEPHPAESPRSRSRQCVSGMSSCDVLGERQSAPTGVTEPAAEPQQERQDPLGGAACSTN